MKDPAGFICSLAYVSRLKSSRVLRASISQRNNSKAKLQLLSSNGEIEEIFEVLPILKLNVQDQFERLDVTSYTLSEMDCPKRLSFCSNLTHF